MYRPCSCSLLFKAPHPHLLLCYYIILNIVLFFIYSVGFPLFFQLSITGAGAGAGTGLIVGLHVGRALGCSGCLGLGSAVPVPHVPGHPTSICEEGIKPLLSKVGLNGQLKSPPTIM